MNNDIRSIDKIKNMRNDLDNTLDEVLNFDSRILNSNLIDKNEPITKDLFKIKKHEIKTELELDEIELEFNTELKDDRKKLKKIKENLNLFDEYNDLILKQKNSKSIDLIQLITFIFLPLGVIVGFFGMNFQKMGMYKSQKTGIYTLTNPIIFIFLLFIIFAVFMIQIYKFMI